MKKKNTAETILIAAAAGAAAAGAIIAIYEVVKSEKGQATIIKIKTGVAGTATKVKDGAVKVAKVVKSKLPGKTAADCELFDEDEIYDEIADVAEAAAAEA